MEHTINGALVARACDVWLTKRGISAAQMRERYNARLSHATATEREESEGADE